MSLTINHDTNDLSATGSGSVTIDGATPGGGGASAISIDIKTADYTVVTGDLGKIIKYVGAGVDRTVTLTAGATLGDGFYVTIANANTGADERVVIDPNGTERFGWSNGPQTITLSRGEMVKIVWDNTSGRWIIGEGGFNLSIRSDINPSTSTAVGDGVSSGIALGYNAQSQGSQAVALGRAYASGTDSFAAAITNNTSSYGATETSSLALGSQAKAAGSYSVAIGSQATTISGFSGAVALGSSHAKGSNSIAAAIGNAGTQFGAIGTGSVAMGYESTASGTASYAIGYRAKATVSDATVFGLEGQSAISCKTAFGGRKFTSSGDCQGAKYILKAETTDATPKEMVAGYASSSVYKNRILALENNSAYAFHGTIVARQKASEGTASAAWKIEGLIRKEGSDATTVLVNSTITALDNTPSWGLSLSANTATNAGNLAITVTGASSTNIRWASNIDTTELTYA